MKNTKPITSFIIGFALCFVLFSFMSSSSNTVSSYKVVKVSDLGVPTAVEDEINKYTNKGWTLVSVYASDEKGSWGTDVCLVLKR